MVFLSCNFVEYETRFVLKIYMSVLIFGKFSKGKSFHYKKNSSLPKQKAHEKLIWWNILNLWEMSFSGEWYMMGMRHITFNHSLEMQTE